MSVEFQVMSFESSTIPTCVIQAIQPEIDEFKNFNNQN